MSSAHVLYICISAVGWRVTWGGTGIPADLHAALLEVFYIFRVFLSFSLYYSLCTRLLPSYRNNCKGILSVVLNYEIGTCQQPLPSLECNADKIQHKYFTDHCGKGYSEHKWNEDSSEYRIN